MRHLPFLLGFLILAGCNTYGYDLPRDWRRAYEQHRHADRGSRAYPDWARVNDRGRTAYLMCHKGNKTRAYRTSAVRGHLSHGDRFGSCNERRDRRARRGERRGRRGYRQGRRYERRGRYEDRRRHDDDDDGYRRRHDDDDD